MNSHQVCAVAGVSYRQLDYWCRCGLVPGQERGAGSGSSRRFTEDQVTAVKAIAQAARVKAMPLAQLAKLAAAGICPARRSAAA